jgi:hypothetical protein
VYLVLDIGNSQIPKIHPLYSNTCPSCTTRQDHHYKLQVGNLGSKVQLFDRHMSFPTHPDSILEDNDRWMILLYWRKLHQSINQDQEYIRSSLDKSCRPTWPILEDNCHIRMDRILHMVIPKLNRSSNNNIHFLMLIRASCFHIGLDHWLLSSMILYGCQDKRCRMDPENCLLRIHICSRHLYLYIFHWDIYFRL